MSNEPVERLKVGRISASIWRREKGHEVWYQTTIQRPYRKDEEWRDSSDFSPGDLKDVCWIAALAYLRIQQLPTDPDVYPTPI